MTPEAVTAHVVRGEGSVHPEGVLRTTEISSWRPRGRAGRRIVAAPVLCPAASLAQDTLPADAAVGAVGAEDARRRHPPGYSLTAPAAPLRRGSAPAVTLRPPNVMAAA